VKISGSGGIEKVPFIIIGLLVGFTMLVAAGLSMDNVHFIKRVLQIVS